MLLRQAIKALFAPPIRNQNHLTKSSFNSDKLFYKVYRRNFIIIPTQLRPITKMIAKADEASADLADSADNEELDADTIAGLASSYAQAREDLSSKWLNYMKRCHVYIYRGGGQPSSSLASFDLDGTIIKPKSNKRIPRNATDWQFFSVWTKVKIQQAIRENDSRLVIFTNQNGVGLRLVALEEVQERIELVTQRLNIPCTVFVAIEKDEFRKPNTAMFRLFEEAFNNDQRVDLEKSFYCGDAVGYPSHSDADIKFAQTLKLPFLPPEKFLRGVKPKLVENKEPPSRTRVDQS